MRHLEGRPGPKFGLFTASLLLASLFIYSSFGIVTDGITLSSQGVIKDSSPSSALAPPPSTPSPGGEIFLWAQFWLVDGNGNPNAVAQRIHDKKVAYGNPTWVEAGNWGSAHLTTTLINYFHSVGIKVSTRLWSRQSAVPLDTLKHSMNPNNGYGGSVDYQLSIGPEIDMFMIDECYQGATSYYQDLASYVHSKGKLFAVNPGGWNIWDVTPTYCDMVSVEFMWWKFITEKQSLIQKYPTKFIGVSNDWGYTHDSAPPNNFLPPKTADGDRPAYSSPMPSDRAVWDTGASWSGGIFYHESRSGDGTSLPSWWEQYLSQLSGRR